MFLFSRVATLQGPPADTLAWASEITEVVNRKDGPETTLWQSAFGGPLGTVSWNTLVESRAHMGELMSQVMADPDFHRLIVDGQQFLSPHPTIDYLRKYVAGTPTEPPEIGAVAEMVTATPAQGRLADAMAWGPEIAMKVGSLIGHGTSFYMEAYGPFGQCTWMSLYPDFAALDQAQDTLMSNDDYLGEIAKGSDLFLGGSGQRGMAFRIA